MMIINFTKQASEFETGVWSMIGPCSKKGSIWLDASAIEWAPISNSV